MHKSLKATVATGLTAITLAACETTQELGRETDTAPATTEAATTMEAASSGETAATATEGGAGSEPVPETQTQATTATPSATAAGDVAVADFAGDWAGRWSGGGARSTLRVTDGQPLRVKYCFAGECKSSMLENVRFEEGEIRFKWGGPFRFSLDGEALEGTYVSNRDGKTYTISMTRK